MKKIAVLLISLAFVACSNNPVPKPDILLDDEVMTNILFDIAILQAANGTMGNKLTENNVKVTTYIYKKYNIDSTTYYQNQRYYAADAKKYKKMYEKVMDKLDEENEALKDKTEGAIKKNDAVERQ